ncbi:sugar phosphate isomerase/epimerase family protein [Lentiprolixibacter aurantiacus]|uniref:Sugar phosphate isomerase/epimerase n=1 Tax=Lentiprolixibacter aurantiacus TaxID=2993939 RepID=A0AAE3SP68_9FLAO|nr:sugar phosphate isomerase/epimerase family protein [Lentiprolixibacter aurantiacus]MCX2719207.1 sugar phosphate isomerase/epimerase [Lentiprolixibacter aurantiacus]
MKRRQFVGQASALGLSTALLGCTSKNQSAKAAAVTEKKIKHNPIGVSTYSFWQFNGPKEDSPIEACIDKAAAMGFDGIELLLVQMASEENSYLQNLKRRAFHAGLDIMGFSTHQGFVNPSVEYRQENIDKTIHQIELAYKLGIPTMRINTGRWGTSENFDVLMANKGIEPAIEGYTDEEGFAWVIDSIEKCLPTAEKCGVVLGLENHWGLGRTAEGVLRIVDAIDSPWLQVTMDTGNFLENREEQLALLAPRAYLIQAKTYFGGGKWYTLDIDYDKIGQMMRDLNYRGYISLEFEGNETPDTAVPKSLELLRKSFYYEL